MTDYIGKKNSSTDYPTQVFCPSITSHHSMGDLGNNQMIIPHYDNSGTPPATSANRIKRPSGISVVVESHAKENDNTCSGAWYSNVHLYTASSANAADVNPGPGVTTERHNGRNNYLYCDGHVEALSNAQMFADRLKLFAISEW